MILCLGTTPVYQRTMIFDRVAPGAVNRARQTYDYASGKSINVARVVHTLGASVLATGFAGGTRGQQLRADLQKAGIEHDFVNVPAQTRQCITVIDRAAGTATELVEESAAVPVECWMDLDDKLKALLPGSRCWIFSGTLPPQAPQDFYARWLPLAREVGAIVILDARGAPLSQAMRFGGFILKINREELAATIEEDLSNEERLLDALRKHAPIGGKIIITGGASPIWAADEGHVWRIEPPAVNAISAVGSGDAFAAGLAVALSRGDSFPEACKLAAACGAANALTPLAGHLDPRVVEHLTGQVKVAAIR